MGTEYTDNFINVMLGWIRWLASNVAGMFQSSGGKGGSFGASVLGWFADNWIGLLIVLILVGVVADWIVWMIRWRPYWLWFRKRRILLDDDIDLDEDDMMLRYGRRPPHFESSDLGRSGRNRREADVEALYEDEEGYEPDLADDGEDLDDYGEEDGAEYDSYEPLDEDEADEYDEYDDYDDADYDALYDEEGEPEAPEDEFDLDEEDDFIAAEAPLADRRVRRFAPKRDRRGLFARRARPDEAEKTEEYADPFEVEDDLFSGLDEDPMRDLVTPAGEPYEADAMQETSVYARPLLVPADEPGAVRPVQLELSEPRPMEGEDDEWADAPSRRRRRNRKDKP